MLDNSRSKFHCQKGFNLIIFLYKIAGAGGGYSWFSCQNQELDNLFSRSKFHCQEGFNLIFFLYKIAGAGGGYSWFSCQKSGVGQPADAGVRGDLQNPKPSTLDAKP